MRDGNILQLDIEEPGPAPEIDGDFAADVLTLGEELVGVVLRNDGLGAFVHDGRQHALVIVLSQEAVDPNQLVRIWLVQHADGDGDHLQVLGSCEGLEVDRPRPDIVDDGALEPRDVEIQPFSVYLVLHPHDAVEDDGAVTSVDSVNGVVRSVGKSTGNGQGGDAARRRSGRTAPATVVAPSGSATSWHVAANLLGHVLECLSKTLRHLAGFSRVAFILFWCGAVVLVQFNKSEALGQ
mmetsp:Transcript_21844/g.62245  ORF Transcript_21844/g.62245 Transcript_21844/m.62245 type:complete len:238 (+) Transcript_21844:629-1342(+)